MSVTRIRIASTGPRKNPAARPTAAPIAMLVRLETSATITEVRMPNASRASSLRPSVSVPSGCAQLMPSGRPVFVRPPIRFCCSGLPNSGAAIAMPRRSPAAPFRRSACPASDLPAGRVPGSAAPARPWRSWPRPVPGCRAGAAPAFRGSGGGECRLSRGHRLDPHPVVIGVGLAAVLVVVDPLADPGQPFRCEQEDEGRILPDDLLDLRVELVPRGLVEGFPGLRGQLVDLRVGVAVVIRRRAGGVESIHLVGRRGLHLVPVVLV